MVAQVALSMHIYFSIADLHSRQSHASTDCSLLTTPDLCSVTGNLLLQGALDAAGACCDGIVDNFGVCNGYDESGVFQVALGSTGTAAQLASALGVSTSKLSTSTE